MGKINTLLLFITVIIFKSTGTYSQAIQSSKEDRISEILGNWYNPASNSWTFGFYEHYVVYDSNFWEYKNLILVNGKGILVLTCKGKTLKLEVNKADDTTLSIKVGVKDALTYRLVKGKLPNYTSIDLTEFKDTHFLTERTSSISGCVQPVPVTEQISISYLDLVTGEYTSHYADIDSLGRFSLVIPLLNTTQVLVELGDGFQLTDVIEPEERFFIHINAASRQSLAMGTNERLHNELSNYNPYEDGFRNDGKLYANDDMLQGLKYLHAKQAQLERVNKIFNNYIDTNPLASYRFKYFIRSYNRHRIGMDLMQKRYDRNTREVGTLLQEYITYVRDSILVSFSRPVGLTTDFLFVTQDHPDYSAPDGPPFSVESRVALLQMVQANLITVPSETKEAVAKIRKLYGIRFSDTLKASILAKNITEKQISDFDALTVKYSREIGDRESALALDTKLTFLEKAILDDDARRVFMSLAIYKHFANLKRPLPIDLFTSYTKRLKSDALTARLTKYQSHLVKLGSTDFGYAESLKKTDHLKGAKNADSLFKALVAPYKGKVIYVDFWGTWCPPCLKEMQYVNESRHKLTGKDVVFMYFANKSPKEAWENVIKELNLTGENVVHYRLPEEQQKLLETRLSVNSFPTYLLIDKKGRIITIDAPRPSDKENLINTITKLLN